MPRQPRIKAESCIYHVILRGNERKRIFEHDGDKRVFLSILIKAKDKYNFLIHGYCIMDNHVHLIINSNGSDVSQVMKSINISYAIYYNNKYKRCGHLFQDRFKSERIESDTYFLQLSKYIHRNPVKAGMVKKAEDYYWSSLRAYIKQSWDNEGLVETEKLLSQIANERLKAVSEYLKYVSEKEDVIAMDVEEDDFTETNDNRKVITDLVQAEKALSKRIVEMGMENDLIRTDIAARNDLIKEIRKNSTLTMKEIGELFGGICESQISRIIKS